MATGRSKLTIDSVWLGAVILLLVLTVWWIPEDGTSGRRDSFSASRSGKKLFYDLVVRLHPAVQRELRQLIPDPFVDTYLLLGPSRYPQQSEWENLYNWVESGHTLVFAARWEDPAVDLYPFPVRIRPSGADSFRERLEPDSARTHLIVSPEIGTEELTWHSQGFIEFGNFAPGAIDHDDGSDPIVELPVPPTVDFQNQARTLVRSGGIQAAALPIGSGYLVVCATDDPFTNQRVRDPASAQIATRLLESGVIVGPISFGESLNRSGGPSGFRLLFDPDFRGFTLQLLICLVLFLWATARRFGPPERGPTGKGRATSEHARALGELYRRRNHGAHVLARYIDYVRDRAGWTPHAETADLLSEAEKLIHSPSLDNRSATAMICQLAHHFESERGS